jgi:tryptophanyl-tRNA synthetase
MSDTKKRILSGMRPTGQLHLGHLYGALQNWVSLQDQYDCYFMVADWHSLTTNYEDIGPIRDFTYDNVIDMLAAGVDPEKSVLFIQSRVLQHAELSLLLGMLAPMPWLERVPTYKDQIRELSNKDLSTFGFLGYPVLMAADILVYKATAVPVGVDQVPHVELTRELARRFNYFYGEVLPEPESLLTPVSKLLGLDGRKMSKSYGNSIYLSDPPKTIEDKVKTMVTDPARIKKTDLGHPDVCPVFSYHKVFEPSVTGDIREACEKASIGCVECKKRLAKEIIQKLAPHHERRAELSQDKDRITDILEEGIKKARNTAEQTMRDVRKAMKLSD